MAALLFNRDRLRNASAPARELICLRAFTNGRNPWNSVFGSSRVLDSSGSTNGHPNGIPSLEERVNLLYTYGVKAGKIDLHTFVNVASTQVA